MRNVTSGRLRRAIAEAACGIVNGQVAVRGSAAFQTAFPLSSVCRPGGCAVYKAGLREGGPQRREERPGEDDAREDRFDADEAGRRNHELREEPAPYGDHDHDCDNDNEEDRGSRPMGAG